MDIQYKIEKYESIKPVYNDYPTEKVIVEYLVVSSKEEFVAPDRTTSLVSPVKQSKPICADDPSEPLYETFYEKDFIYYAWLVWWWNHD